MFLVEAATFTVSIIKMLMLGETFSAHFERESVPKRQVKVTTCSTYSTFLMFIILSSQEVFVFKIKNAWRITKSLGSGGGGSINKRETQLTI